MALFTIRRRPPPAHEAPRPEPASVLPAPAVPSSVDAIAPHSAELTRDALRLDDSYTAGLAVTQLPSAVVAGQLLPVCAADIPFSLSVQIQPIPRPSAQRFLLAQTARHGSAQLVSTSRLGNPERDTALEHVSRGHGRRSVRRQRHDRSRRPGAESAFLGLRLQPDRCDARPGTRGDGGNPPVRSARCPRARQSRG